MGFWPGYVIGMLVGFVGGIASFMLLVAWAVSDRNKSNKED